MCHFISFTFEYASMVIAGDFCAPSTPANGGDGGG
jgi:hypothetical protein